MVGDVQRGQPALANQELFSLKVLFMFKTCFVSLPLLTAGALTLCAFRAEAWSGEDGDSGRTNCSDFHGVANLQQGLALTPTTNAPAGAAGKAVFIAVDDNGTNYTLLFVKTTGLTNGAYSVQLADDSRTNFFDLGTLNVTTRTNFNHDSDDDDQGDSDHESDSLRRLGRRHGWDWSHFPEGVAGAGWTNWLWQCASTNHDWTNLFNLGNCTNLHWFATNAYCWYTNTRSAGSGSFTLPDGLTQSNATVINVLDAETNIVLTGDFSGATNSTVIFKEIADIIPGTATNAQGTATIRYRLVNSIAVGSFRLNASGLPPKEKLYLTANGTNTIKVCTRRNGTLRVSRFRGMDFSSLTEIVATDTSSNIVFTVNF